MLICPNAIVSPFNRHPSARVIILALTNLSPPAFVYPFLPFHVAAEQSQKDPRVLHSALGDAGGGGGGGGGG